MKRKNSSKELVKKTGKKDRQKTKTPIRKNSFSAIKAIKEQSQKRKGSRTITNGRSTQVQKNGFKSYNEGFNVGFAKGFEDGHTLAYQGDAN